MRGKQPEQRKQPCANSEGSFNKKMKRWKEWHCEGKNEGEVSLHLRPGRYSSSCSAGKNEYSETEQAVRDLILNTATVLSFEVVNPSATSLRWATDQWCKHTHQKRYPFHSQARNETREGAYLRIYFSTPAPSQ
jgi:hypothetical protein